MLPLISLVITVYNRASYLSAAIESILAQTRGDFELLIWDDGSTDSSPEIAREYARRDSRVRVVVGEHVGRGLALKAAVAQTTAPYLGWVDSDDLLAPTALAETAAVLAKNPDIDWVYTDYLDIDENNTVISYGYRCLVPYSRAELLNNFMTFHFRLMRREVFDLAGGIDESLETVEDYDLCLRLSEIAKVQHIFQPLYYYRTHRGSISRQRQQEQIKKSHQAVIKAQKRRKLSISSLITTLAASCLPFLGGLSANFAQAQSITPANDDTGTIVNTQNNNIDISGGSLSGDGANLFHSFSQFGLDANQTANFLSQPSIQNILGRVTGSNASLINGLITVTGGNSNLYLINPAGIIFGPNASLNVPGSFTATTANRIGFGDNWLNISGENNYATLLGNPNSFAFDTSIAGTIINEGNLAVTTGNNLTLLGGTVVSTGELSAPNAKIIVASIPGTSLVRFSIPGNPLSLEVQPLLTTSNLSANSLPQLLTGGGGNATKLIVNSNGEVELTGSGLQIKDGDVVVQKLNTDTATIAANNNLILPESQLATTGNLNLIAENTVKVRDSVTNPFSATSGGNLYIQGKQGIDVLALNSLQKTPFVSGGNLTFVSDGNISLDAYFASGGNFSIFNSQGNAQNFISLYDPIISSDKDVTFGTYNGPALKVESRGSITINGDVTITSPDFNINANCNCSDEAKTLGQRSALILRAGLSQLIEPFSDIIPNLDTTQGPSSPGNVNVTGNIQTSSYGGPVIISATGDINLANIDASVNSGLGNVFNTAGKVELIAGGNIKTGDISTASTWNDNTATGGSIVLEAGGNVTTGIIISSGLTPNTGNAIGGAINIKASGNIQTSAIDSSAITANNINTEFFDQFSDATAGSVTLNSTGGFVKTGIISGFAKTYFGGASTGSTVNITATDNIEVSAIDSFANSNIYFETNNPTRFTLKRNLDNAIGGQITLNAGKDIQTGLINSFATTQNIAQAQGGLIDLTASNNITTTNIDSFATANSGTATAGGINLKAGNQINTNAVIASADSQQTATGGAINLKSVNSLTTGRISTATNSASPNSAFSGAVTLETTQIGSNITFDSINTSANNLLLTGTAVGGEVKVLANGTVRGLDIISTANQTTNDTIVTTGANSSGITQSGAVTIQHDGGFNNVNFIVGDSTINGLKGNITAGNSQINTTSSVNSFPVLPNGGIASGTPSNISIISINTPPTLTTGNTQLPTIEENKSVTFTFGDLLTSTGDVNLDNRSVILDAITTGTLTLQDGTPVTANTTLSANTILVYTPLANTSGNITAFSIKASDNVSFSAPQPITINITPFTPPDTSPKIPDNLPNPEELQKTTTQLPTGGITPSGLTLDTTVAEIETKFTNQFQQYLGLSTKAEIRNLDEGKEILQKINKATGANPALIYINFEPDSPASTNINQSPSDRLELVLVTAKGKPTRKVLNVTRSQVLKIAQTFKIRVTDPALRNDYQDAAKQLNEWLITPLESELQIQKIDNLTFILDSGLRSLPLAALYDGQKYLVERYSVGLMPSLSLSDTEYVDIKKAEVLGMGASKFSNQKPLPAVPIELATITPRLWQGRSFVNQFFTLKNLQAQRQQIPYGIIHLATHGEFKPGKPNQSYIQLWDSQLTMDRLRELGWNNPPVQLVVLSACRTAVGDEEAELGFAGFAIQAGAKSALASLWYVSDEGTLGLMSEFYEQLRTAPIKAEAVRRTQVAMLKGQVRLEDGKLKTSVVNINLPPELQKLGNKNLQHPYFWSAFTLIGNPW
jgi:filamentous hemagglutinin family protein